MSGFGEGEILPWGESKGVASFSLMPAISYEVGLEKKTIYTMLEREFTSKPVRVKDIIHTRAPMAQWKGVGRF